MNSATGPEKIEAIATLVTALVEQRNTMRSGMLTMHEQMMGHMMQHMMSMQGGMMGGGMMSCPMMQQMQKEAAEK